MSDCCKSCSTGAPCCSLEKSFEPEAFDGFINFENRPVAWKAKKNFRPVRKINFQGLDISIEHDKGMVRHWKDDATGETGTTKMAYPYGYICRTEGADGEQTDVFVGPNENSDKVFIVHQMKKPDFTRYDEDKVMLGFDSAREAKSAYLMHFNSPKFFGSMTTTTIDDFKRMFVSKSMDTAPVEGLPAMPGMASPAPGKNSPSTMLMVDPHDVETYEGVESLLGRLGSVKDPELMQIATKIWGKGYDYQGRTPMEARIEILGWLLDQRDLLGVQAPEPPMDIGLISNPAVDQQTQPIGLDAYLSEFESNV